MIRALAPFRTLNYKEVARVLNIVQRRTLAEGDDPYASSHDALCIILAGRIGVYHQGQHIEHLDASCAFGLLNLLDGKSPPSQLTYRAEEETTLMVLSLIHI